MRSPGSATAAATPVLVVLVSAILWGLFWVPVRLLEAQGFQGLWAGAALVAGAAVPAAAAMLAIGVRSYGWRDLAGALAMGTAIALYASAISFGDVVRVVILFYIAPAWSLLIECVFLGRRWTWWSSLAIGLSLVGIVVICRGEIPLEGLGALGDWMALFAGLSWSIGAAFVFAGGDQRPVVLASGAAIGAAIVMALCITIGAQGWPDVVVRSMERGELISLLAPVSVALALGLVYLLTVLVITLWGALRLSPTTMSFLLTAEIISGVSSSAMFLGERFGAYEAVGTILIVSGALVEVLPAVRGAQARPVAGS